MDHYCLHMWHNVQTHKWLDKTSVLGLCSKFIFDDANFWKDESRDIFIKIIMKQHNVINDGIINVDHYLNP